jgi:hypothetical protein
MPRRTVHDVDSCAEQHGDAKQGGVRGERQVQGGGEGEGGPGASGCPLASWPFAWINRNAPVMRWGRAGQLMQAYTAAGILTGLWSSSAREKTEGEEAQQFSQKSREV